MTSTPRSQRFITILLIALITLLYLSSFLKAINEETQQNDDSEYFYYPSEENLSRYQEKRNRHRKQQNQTKQQQQQQQQPVDEKADDENLLDFFIAGFPRCGTTTLLKTFARHPETIISNDEYCGLTVAKTTDDAISRLASHLDELVIVDDDATNVTTTTRTKKKRGIKCPMSVRHVKSLQRLLASTTPSSSKTTKLIVGLRHPVSFFESFYNYRVAESHHIRDGRRGHYRTDDATQEDVVIPSPLDLHRRRDAWNKVSTELARFDVSLKQLNVVDLSTDDVRDLATSGDGGGGGYELLPSHELNVFLYHVEQLGDDLPRGGDNRDRLDDDDDDDGIGTTTRRAERFRNDLRSFLGLTRRIDPFDRMENRNDELFYNESFNICDGKYDELRATLVTQGEVAKRWIKDEFTKSERVSVGGGRGRFVELLDLWGVDPCSNRRSLGR